MHYDIIIVGSGLYGAAFARVATDAGMRCLVLERRKHIAGNVYDEVRQGINIHCYGPHIFHTDDEDVWRFVSRFATFNSFRNMPLAHYKGRLYNLPFNMHTFYQVYGVTTPADAMRCIDDELLRENYPTPRNLEEQAVSLIGRPMYEILIKGYTEKQWGRKATELPPSIISRLPLRFTFDNSYFNDRWQGIPEDGYTAMVRRMLDGIEVMTETDFNADRNYWLFHCRNVMYTGSLDELHKYVLGQLPYRSLRFEHTAYNCTNLQGCAVINETDGDIPYTRVIEHRHFSNLQPDVPVTIVTKEFPLEWSEGMERFYPLPFSDAQNLYERYRDLTAEVYPTVMLGGRLGLYRYLDMDDCIAHAMQAVESVKSN